jgi:hypothetical protein
MKVFDAVVRLKPAADDEPRQFIRRTVARGFELTDLVSAVVTVSVGSSRCQC